MKVTPKETHRFRGEAMTAALPSVSTVSAVNKGSNLTRMLQAIGAEHDFSIITPYQPTSTRACVILASIWGNRCDLHSRRRSCTTAFTPSLIKRSF